MTASIVQQLQKQECEVSFHISEPSTCTPPAACQPFFPVLVVHRTPAVVSLQSSAQQQNPCSSCSADTTSCQSAIAIVAAIPFQLLTRHQWTLVSNQQFSSLIIHLQPTPPHPLTRNYLPFCWWITCFLCIIYSKTPSWISSQAYRYRGEPHKCWGNRKCQKSRRGETKITRKERKKYNQKEKEMPEGSTVKKDTERKKISKQT